jgi:hypothetical protein
MCLDAAVDSRPTTRGGDQDNERQDFEHLYSRTARKTPTMIPVTIMWPRSGHLTGLFDGGDRRNPRMF